MGTLWELYGNLWKFALGKRWTLATRNLRNLRNLSIVNLCSLAIGILWTSLDVGWEPLELGAMPLGICGTFGVGNLQDFLQVGVANLCSLALGNCGTLLLESLQPCCHRHIKQPPFKSTPLGTSVFTHANLILCLVWR